MKRIALLLSVCVVLIKAVTPGVTEHQGAMMPLDITLIDENGKRVQLGELMGGKPTIMTFNYYRCAGICTPQLTELAKMLGKVDLKEGKDYNVITVGFADDENYTLAAAKKANILPAIGRKFDPDAWHFTANDGNNSAVLADIAGFQYEKKLLPSGVTTYVHGAIMVMLSPQGKITRYFNGVNQLPFDIKMGLLEASEGRVGPTIAKTLLYCFAYDPKGRTYVFKWEKVIGVVMTLLLVLFFIFLIRSSKKGKNNTRQESNHNRGENE